MSSTVVIGQVKDLFLLIDKETERMKALTGINCPDMCGICCEKAEVETTAVEMLPLAAELWEKGEADTWLDAIERAERPDSCVFYRKDPDDPGRGRCGVYALRPLICRLFGLYTTRDKNGKYVYGGCRIIKDRYPDLYRKAAGIIAAEPHPSKITDYSIRIISMGTDIGRRMLPINTAAKAAIEKIGFELIKRSWT